MNLNRGCSCKAEPPAASGPAHRQAPPHQGLRVLGWLAPGTVLVLLPKCPVCMAGYIAAFTGLGVSLTTAAAVRFSLADLCIAAMVLLLMRSSRRPPARPAAGRHGTRVENAGPKF